MATAVVDLLLNTKEALKDVREFSRKSQKSVQEVASSFNLLKKVAIGAAGVFAGRAILGGIRTVTQAAQRQEDAVKGVSAALETAGEFTEATINDFQRFASSLQDATGVGDEASLEMIALAKSFDASNEQAKLMTQAAIELAAATGKSTDEAIRQVSKTLGGFAGELGEVNPRIKELTAEQLKAGDAARILLEQYGGTARRRLDTFSGAVSVTEGRFGDLLETVGELITKNPVVIQGIKDLGSFFQNLDKALQANRGELNRLVSDSLTNLKDALPDIKTGFQDISEILNDKLIPALETVGSFVKDAQDLGSAVADAAGFVSGVSTPGQISGPQTRTEAQIKLADELRSIGISDKRIEEIIEKQNLKMVTRLIKDGKVDRARQVAEDILEEQKKTTREVASSVKKTNVPQAKKIAAEIDNTEGFRRLNQLAAEPRRAIQADPEADRRLAALGAQRNQDTLEQIEAQKKAAEEARLAGETWRKVGTDVGVSFLQGLSKGGEDGAKSFVQAGAVGLATAFGGPLAGKIAGPIAELLLQGPEATKEAIRSFADALPSVVTSLAEAAPVFVTTLADKADEIIIALADPKVWIPASVAFAKAIAIEAPIIIVRGFGRRINTELQKVGLDLEPIREQFTLLGTESLTQIQGSFGQINTEIQNLIPSVSIALDGVSTDIENAFEPATRGISEIARDFRSAVLSIGPSFKKAVSGIDSDLKNLTGSFFQGIRQGLDNTGRAAGAAFDRAAGSVASFRGKAEASINGIGNQFANLPNKILTPIASALTNFGNNVASFFTDLAERIKSFFNIDIGGGGGGFVGQIARGEAFALGGVVPPGYPDDSYPALLTSGERVLTPEETDSVDGIGATQEAILAMLGQIVSLLSQPQTVQSQVQLNQKAFADIILNLNRTNARLA